MSNWSMSPLDGELDGRRRRGARRRRRGLYGLFGLGSLSGRKRRRTRRRRGGFRGLGAVRKSLCPGTKARKVRVGKSTRCLTTAGFVSKSCCKGVRRYGKSARRPMGIPFAIRAGRYGKRCGIRTPRGFRFVKSTRCR